MTALAFPEHTVAEVLRQLEGRGYRGVFRIEEDTIPPGLYCGHCRRHLLPERVRVAELWRFEGASDPGDQAIVFAFACPRCGNPGTLTCAYGPGSSPAEAEVISTLDGNRSRGASHAGPPGSGRAPVPPPAS